MGAFSQYKLDKAICISKENGLPVNEAGSVQKSEDGFIWIGTDEGLCRFDGQFVKVYQAGEDPVHSLFDNRILAILPVKNFIWIGTPQGVSVLDTKNNTFRHYQFDNYKKIDTLKRRFDQGVRVLYKDKSGTIWLGTNRWGVCAYDEKKRRLPFLFFLPGKISPTGTGYRF
jgi:ligand-binding sensor domain-containing protein